MLKDEVALSKEKINKLDVEPLIQSVVDDLITSTVLKKIKIFYQNDGKNNYLINGIENRIEQIIANLLDNAISFGEDNKEIIVALSKTKDDEIVINIVDQGEVLKKRYIKDI